MGVPSATRPPNLPTTGPPKGLLPPMMQKEEHLDIAKFEVTLPELEGKMEEQLNITNRGARIKIQVPTKHEPVCLSDSAVPPLEACKIKGLVLVTRGPTAEDKEVFWRLILERGLTKIICLAETRNESDCDEYWPTEIGDAITIKFSRKNELVIKRVKDNLRQGKYTQRMRFVLHNGKKEHELEIVNFFGWPRRGTPAKDSWDELMCLL